MPIPKSTELWAQLWGKAPGDHMAGHIETYEGARGTTFRIIADAGRDENEKRRRVKRTLPKGTTRAQAEKALAKLVTDVDRQQANLVGNRMTLADLHDE